MKYTLVKQFSNNSYDNFFKFFYKIVDFGKVLLDLFWAFFDIWSAFFMIFFNLFMYVYYLILFLIDWSTESRSGFFFWKKKISSVSRTPVIDNSIVPNPFIKKTTTIKPLSSGISARSSFSRPSSARIGAKKTMGKSLAAITLSIFETFKKIILFPFTAPVSFFSRKMKPVKETASPEPTSSGKSLIDEYMREYEKKKG